MTAPARIAAFAAALAMTFGVAVLAGGVIDPKAPAKADSGQADSAGHDDGMSSMSDKTAHSAEAGEADGVPGLAVADTKLRLVADRTTLPAGRTATYTFRIVDTRGRTIRDFELEHGRRLHLIAVRRDLTGYQHLHPTQAADGTWSVPLRFAEPGTYRVYADFIPKGAEKTTLGTDVLVDGNATYLPLPALAQVADVDGYQVQLSGTAPAGQMGKLTFTLTRNGRPVNDIQPYLQARGHLVALRQNDLAYLHVHPEDAATPGDRITFMTELPSAGAYRLFLQFKHHNKIHTVAFTQEVR
ncbi:MAG TPA: hypothetical protein VNT03_05725 [Baekduia sp.]|nr:hypothetical protein [Baekduia sp.]